MISIFDSLYIQFTKGEISNVYFFLEFTQPYLEVFDERGAPEATYKALLDSYRFFEHLAYDCIFYAVGFLARSFAEKACLVA